MTTIGDLGAPVGVKKPDVTEFSEAGEHGQGVGISGGHGIANASNTQSGGDTGFNAGLGGDHASAGIPKSGEHPIADKFMGQSAGGPGAVSGAYEGGSTGDGLTGQSTASTTGAGVGPLAENTGDQSRAAALGTTAGGAAAAAGVGAASTQSGVGPSGGAGGHYSSSGGAAAEEPASDSPLVNDGQAKGHFGHADADESRGKPVSDPKELDTGGPYSLVFQESTGKYVHRHELEEQK